MEEIYQIFDKIIKRILTLSAKTVINLINGLFDTNYPLDSKITYNWTEHEDNNLKRTLSDSILTINDKDSYHIEAQMTKDNEIIFRVFEYGFGHAYKNRIIEISNERMIFPKPCVIYLDAGNKDTIPDEYTLILEFKDQGEFHYKVPIIKLQNYSVQEINEQKLIALLPFLLLKLRKKIDKMRTKENLEELHSLVMDDIIGSINMNEAIGNISPTDALNLKALVTKLYMQLYSKYEELEGITMRLFDQSIELPGDKYEKTVEELQDEVAEMKDIIEQRDATIEECNTTIQNLMAQIEQLQNNH